MEIFKHRCKTKLKSERPTTSKQASKQAKQKEEEEATCFD